MLFDPCQSFSRAIVVRGSPPPRTNNFQTHHTISHHHRHPCTHVNKLLLGLTWLWALASRLRLPFRTGFFNHRTTFDSKVSYTYLFLFDAFMSSQQAFRLILTRLIWVCERVFGYQNCLINTVNGGNRRQYSEYRIHILLLLLIVSSFYGITDPGCRGHMYRNV